MYMNTDKLAALKQLAIEGDLYAMSCLDAAADIADLKAGTEGPDIVAKVADVGAPLTLTLAATPALDGVTLTAGMIVLVKNQGAPADNGLYVVASTSTVTWARLLNEDGTSVLKVGMKVAVQSGVLGANSIWMLSNGAANTFISAPVGAYGVTGDMVATGLAEANSAGVSALLARVDHAHAANYGVANDMAAAGLAAANAAGSSVKPARIDHVHAMSFNVAPAAAAATVAGQAVSSAAGAGGVANGSAVGGIGGARTLAGGAGGAATSANNAGNGGAASLTGGQGGAGAATKTAGAGANASLIGGAAGAVGGGTGNNGGNAVVDAGAASGAGTAGVVNVGTSNASAVNIAQAGITTTIGGPMAMSSNKITGLTDGAAAKDAAAMDQLSGRITATAVRLGAGTQTVTINLKDATGAALGNVDVTITSWPTTDGADKGVVTTGATGSVLKTSSPATGPHFHYCVSASGVLVVTLTDSADELVYLLIESANCLPFTLRVTTAA